MRDIFPFLLASGLVIISPGPGEAVVTKSALLAGRRGALLAALGIEVGLITWALASVLGVMAALAAAPVLFAMVRLLGGLYLIALGAQTVRLSRLSFVHNDDPAQGRLATTGWTSFKQGLMCNLLNPKAALFLGSALPDFIESKPKATLETAAFAGAFLVIALVWLTSYALFAAALRDTVRRPRFTQALNLVSGSVLVGFGIQIVSQVL